MTDRVRSASLKLRASRWEDADFTAGHSSYRTHLENLRRLLVGIEYVVSRDTNETSRWMRQHNSKKRRRLLIPSSCWKVGVEGRVLALRYRLKGKLVAELVDEAAQAVVVMAQIHQQYVHMERRHVPEEGRYRRSDT